MRRVVLAGLTGLVLATGWSGAPGDADPEPDPTAGRSGDAAVLDCRDPVPPATSLPVTAGALRAQLCDPGTSRWERWQPPQQWLTKDVGGLVAVLDAQEPFVLDPGSFCPAVGGTPFDLRLAYPDGTVVAVSGHTGGCGELEVDGNRYGGAKAVLRAFLRRMEDQRATSTPPPFEPVRLACGGHEGDLGSPLSPIGDPPRLVRAVSCWRPNADETGAFHRSRIPERRLGPLLADLERRSFRQRKPSVPGCRSSDLYYWQDILGQTDWGDVVRIRGVCDEFQVDHGTYWKPGRAAQQVLDRLRLSGR